MTPKEFVAAYWHDAKEVEKTKRIATEATLAQAAWESAWGKAAPGNMFFGEKDFDGINGNEQLLVTTEISKRFNCTPKELGLTSIISVTAFVSNGQKYFKYVGKAYFKKFNTPTECFAHHADFFYKNSRYAKALTVSMNAEAFVNEIATAGYATDPAYARNLINMIKNIRKIATELKLI